ncbi:MAG: dienelactone hydrolase family protein [Verrucomicrobia bacterium]|nr:dienelactone hydrolase family protein [Verrucomicrobiota bacterium]
MKASSLAASLMSLLVVGSLAADDKFLPGTQPLTGTNDLSLGMIAGIDRFLDRELAASVERRAAKWHRNFSSPEAYTKSVEPNRERFRRIIGVVDERVKPELHLLATPTQSAQVGEGWGYKIFAVRWSVLPGVDAEGWLLQPNQEPVADIVALPDCDTTPEMLIKPFPARLAQMGCRVLVPMLMDRRDTYSGNPKIRMTNQPHREFIYRAAFEMGHHIIGYEVQKVLAAVDWFSADAKRPIGVIGYGEGGLLAFYSAAVDTRINAALVSGYFQTREQVWREPIYRNVSGLLEEFGDAEIASLVAPRALVIEASRHPEIARPPAPSQGRAGAAPGVIATPSADSLISEFNRAKKLVEPIHPPLEMVLTANYPFLPDVLFALDPFLKALKLWPPPSIIGGPGHFTGNSTVDAERFHRQFDQLVEHTQRVLREGEARRAELWTKPNLNLSHAGFPPAKDSAAVVKKYQEDTRWYRDYLWDEVIGRFPPASLPMNPRSRLVYDEPTYRGYEVMLDVWPDVYAYGILLVPKDLKSGERRPVVVCQHGLEGRPQDCANPKVESRYYHSFANKLTERGFITFSPQNPYIGKDEFRVLQRKLNPLGKTLFAVIARQHERTLDWLAALPFVDGERIAFYGLSYGGKSAMRLPAMLEKYCLSICSGDYNEWIAKNASTTFKGSYMFTGEYEIFEWNLGNTFNYAEMSWLICPRPFMVERGHFDGVGVDEMVAYEYAKTKRRYDLLGTGDRCEFEYFSGPHEIHAVGTFDFLHKHLNWPKR